READQKFCESLILSRMKRLRENESVEAAKQKVLEDLNKCLGEYKSKYYEAKEEFESVKNEFEKFMEDYEKEIKNLNEKKEYIDNQEKNTLDKIGLQGNTLVQFLSSIRAFAK